jgi:hypothetical protein
MNPPRALEEIHPLRHNTMNQTHHRKNTSTRYHLVSKEKMSHEKERSLLGAALGLTVGERGVRVIEL